ncbi:MAG TPA: glycosyltransferase family 4 protein [Acidimicrobiia bacterium]|jgi:glycosyltransferase involved in cell wall biosynthesis|nr:glycosyltransferase family 4 protein [Acidimicrobiia bacterium]
MAPQAVTVSFRLGGDDGVSVEARKWTGALHELGFETRRVAGTLEGASAPDDVVIPTLAIGANDPVDPAALRAALEGADLVIVDNLCSLPLNVDAARTVAAVVSAHPGRVCFRHHDLPWQRRQLAHLEDEFPPRTDGALHATINLRSRRELHARGYGDAVTVHNYFDLDPPPGDRAVTRSQLGFADDDFVLFQPARAIERKNVPGALRFAHQLHPLAPDLPLRLWISGPAEDGYAPVLDRIIERAEIPVSVGRAATASDAYAASDLVLFPSTWEGFGNPVVEAIAYRRACAAYPYPVLAELVAAGVRVFSTQQPEAVVKFLAESTEVRERYFDANVNRARVSYSIADLPAAIDETFSAHGWISW